MKRCALIISDELQLREWLGCQVTRQWPKMLLEHSRLANGSSYLDRTELARYQLIIVRLGFKTSAELKLCISLMRILNLPVRPDIVIISDNERALRRASSTALAAATCLPAEQVSDATMRTLLAGIARYQDGRTQAAVDGAPDIPGYQVLEPIAGTYGATLYRAYSERHETDVALKVCELASSNDTQPHGQPLRREYETLLALGGDYVARAYDYGELDRVAYMALEYFPRGSIGGLFASAGRYASRVTYLRRVAEALRHIHDAGFLHLDLKPNNVMIREDNTPALIDFGISTDIAAARCPKSVGYSTGSPHFMSPEQLRGEALDVRSDLYGFGALWFRVFTGQVPFPGRNLDEIGAARDAAGAPGMGEALRPYQPIVDKTLAGDPELRFSTAQELISNIDHYFSTATGRRRMPYFVERRQRYSRSALDSISNIDFYFGTAPGKHRMPHFIEQRKRDSQGVLAMHDQSHRRSKSYDGTRRRAYP